VYITDFNRSILLENSEISFFDTRDDDSVVIEVWGQQMTGRILHGRSMLDLITEITAYTGRMQAPPTWTQQGAIIGLEGGTEEVSMKLDKILAVNKANISVPVSAIWLQDWTGLRHSYDGDRLMWNWQLDYTYYPQWDQLVHSARSSGIRVLTYINPYFSHPFIANKPAQSSVNYRNLYKEGLDRGYFVQAPGAGSGAYKLWSGSIPFCMLDTTNPAAREWMKDIIKEVLLKQVSSSGFMADFGEYLPFDARLHNSSVSAAEYHNRYPQEWGRVVAEAVSEFQQEKVYFQRKRKTYGDLATFASPPESSDDANDIVYFMRSGWMHSPGLKNLVFWLGDQMVSWDRHDGIKSVLVAALSGGIGGHSLTHSDIGGFTMSDVGPLIYIRSTELLLRWIELAAFGSALFRSHVGLSTSPRNAQLYDSEATTLHFAKFASIFAFLAPYRSALLADASQKGWPLMRHMAAHFAYDPKVWPLTQQFLFGEDFLVAPVLDPAPAIPSATASSYLSYLSSCVSSVFGYFLYVFGSDSARAKSLRRKRISDIGPLNPEDFRNQSVSEVKVYIPAFSDWVHLWTGQEVSGGDLGRTVRVDAPFGSPPVFYRKGSSAGKDLRHYVLTLQADAITVPSDRPRPVLDANCVPLSNEGSNYEGPSQGNGEERSSGGSRRRYRQQDGCPKARIRDIITHEPSPSWVHWLLWKGTPAVAEDNIKWAQMDSPRVSMP